jgi:hypothetical protein
MEATYQKNFSDSSQKDFDIGTAVYLADRRTPTLQRDAVESSPGVYVFHADKVIK